MTKQSLENNLTSIKEIIESEVVAGDIINVQEKLLKLSSLVGLSAECMKWAKKYFLDAQKIALLKYKGTDKNYSIIKMFVESELAEEAMIYTYCERLNAGIVHSIDSLRTIISLYKSEMENSRFQQG